MQQRATVTQRWLGIFGHAGEEWLEVLKATGCRWIDNVSIERLWRSVKYEEVYLHAYRDGREAQRSLRAYFETYNRRRLHQALDYRTPNEVYFSTDPGPVALAA
jgi:transposase InsO family protein